MATAEVRQVVVERVIATTEKVVNVELSEREALLLRSLQWVIVPSAVGSEIANVMTEIGQAVGVHSGREAAERAGVPTPTGSIRYEN